jgi:hypothetical protein
MHHEDEQGKEHVVDELKSEEDPQVQPDFELEVSHPHLTEHSSRRHEGHPYDKHESKPQELAQEEDPLAHRGRVGNLAASVLIHISLPSRGCDPPHPLLDESTPRRAR